LPEKEKHVEIYNVDDYKEWVKTQPAMLFHEMVHGYHRRQLNNSSHILMLLDLPDRMKIAINSFQNRTEIKRN